MAGSSDVSVENLFFVFGDKDAEIEKKYAALKWSPKRARQAFDAVLAHLSIDDAVAARVGVLYDSLQRAYEDRGSSMSHPVRVAGSWLLDLGQVSYDQISLSLCHNVREVGKGALEAIEEEYLSSDVRHAIGLLTIDRPRERDETYMTKYYDDIDAAGLMPLKGFDKLDNFLSFVFKEVDPFYYGVVDTFVCPRLEKSDARLATYLFDVSRHVRVPVVRERFSGHNRI